MDFSLKQWSGTGPSPAVRVSPASEAEVRGVRLSNPLSPGSTCLSLGVFLLLMLDLKQLDVILRQPTLRPIELDVRRIDDSKLLQLVIFFVFLLDNLNVHSTKDTLLCGIPLDLRSLLVPHDLLLLFLLSRLSR